MQPTTMTDIEKMEKKAPEATFVADTTPNEADEVTVFIAKHPNSLRATSKLKA